MPLSVPLDDRAIKYLVSRPKPSQLSRDTAMAVRESNEVNNLARMGRGILRGCVVARTLQPPISHTFDVSFRLKTWENAGQRVCEVARGR
jgi:hypothetical protein